MYDLVLHIIIQVLNVRVLFYPHFSQENEKTGNVYHVFIRMLKSYRLLGTFIRFYNKWGCIVSGEEGAVEGGGG